MPPKSSSEQKRDEVFRLAKEGRRPTDIVAHMKSTGYSRASVFRALARLRTRRGIKDKKRAGRKRTVRTKKVVNGVERKLSANPRASVRKLSKQMNLSRTSLSRVVKDDLGLRAFKRRRCQFVSEESKAKRLSRCMDLLDRDDLQHVMFTDEKKWTIEEHFNSQNDRIYAARIEDLYDNPEYLVTRIQAPKYVMVWGAITTNGKFKLVFLPDDRMTANKYRARILTSHVRNQGDQHFNHEHWTFQQDGAPIHREKGVQQWLSNSVPSFVKASEWPPYSPDLNPCDYFLWGRLEALVNTKRFDSIDSLKAAIRVAWDALDDREIASACAQFRKRLMLCVRASGGVFSTK